MYVLQVAKFVHEHRVFTKTAMVMHTYIHMYKYVCMHMLTYVHKRDVVSIINGKCSEVHSLSNPNNNWLTT